LKERLLVERDRDREREVMWGKERGASGSKRTQG
jgi:hypothetical protein